MGTRTSYGPGTFCWVNLSSTDVDAAKRFCAELLGWDYDDRAADDGTFSMARRYDANVAAIYEQEEQERELGQPPHWNNYVSVEDTDAAAFARRSLALSCCSSRSTCPTPGARQSLPTRRAQCSGYGSRAGTSAQAT
jgi:predicted enzyme related to lactoylglutathione lyase